MLIWKIGLLDILVSEKLWLGTCVALIFIVAFSSLWSVQYKQKKVLEYIQKYVKGISNYNKFLIINFKRFDPCVNISAFTNIRNWDVSSVKCQTLFLSYFLDTVSQFLKYSSFLKFWEFSFLFSSGYLENVEMKFYMQSSLPGTMTAPGSALWLWGQLAWSACIHTT